MAMRKPVLLFGLVVVAYTLVTSCDNFNADYVSSSVSSDEQGDQKACALNELKYLWPPLNYSPYAFENQAAEDKEPFLLIPNAVSIPEDSLLLIGYWRNDFADSRTAERDYVQFGHVVKSSVMYHIIDPKTDLATLVHKETREEFIDRNPDMPVLASTCNLSIYLPSYEKTYMPNFCVGWDYCNPPKTAFTKNMIVTNADGQEGYISLPME
jgi:hypothetical protein